MSSLYPTPVSEIPELKAQFQGQQYPGADILVDRLVTLPVHRYVDECDIARICEVLHGIVAGADPSVAARHGRVTDRSPSPAETPETGASKTGQ